MKIKKIHLRNFRRLENVEIDFEEDETVFVGPNNSGKTSATTAFRLFLKTQRFKVFDFSVSKIAALDAFGNSDEANDDSVPAIEMDIWFSIDPNIEFGRVFSLVPNVSLDLNEVGVRLKYCVKDATKLRESYLSTFPRRANGGTQKSMTHYLTLEGNLNRHFGLDYFSLEQKEDEILAHLIDPKEGKRVLHSLIRVDFVNAQRNIDDDEVGRSNRLSSAFAAFYKKNLEQAAASEEANRVIDENNENLNQHYETHFTGLMTVIQGLGVPSINDRQMKVVSSLSPEVALQGGTALLYVDPAHNHELPEAYNGLGFKNLVYMAIQISHFHLQWMTTKEKRPLCQIIFVEEPEAHLHAQVQQTFISNIWNIVRKASEKRGEAHMVPQLGITTHSSHILDSVGFQKVRYFRRCVLDGEDPTITETYNGSKVLSLREFKPQKSSADGTIEDEEETLNFLKTYLKLTHCDLFFADAAIMVEGTVEKLLLSKMIEKSAPKLSQNYLTILEVGGAYAHRFASLLEFLGIHYLVITDLDSIDPANGRKVCRADTQDAVTSNASLKFFLNKSAIEELVSLTTNEKILADGKCCVVFQKPTIVTDHATPMHGRTFEETFVYQNIKLFRDNLIDLGIVFSNGTEFDQEYQSVFNRIKSSSFKKTEFALNVASSTVEWETPLYISDGLCWLESQINRGA